MHALVRCARAGAALALLALAACDGQDAGGPWPLRAYCAARAFVERDDFRVRGERSSPDPCAKTPTPADLLDPDPGAQDEGSDSLDQ